MLCETCGRNVPVRRDGRLKKHRAFSPAEAARRGILPFFVPRCAASEMEVPA